MKKILFFICFIIPVSMFSQNVDITIFSQNDALNDSLACAPAEIEQLAAYPFISESYNIPAYGLYSQLWDTVHIRSKILEIPFSNDRLMLMLVQDANNPFVMPCRFEKVKNLYGTNKKGVFHTGIDLLTDAQTLVKSCFDGVVRISEKYGDYGLVVVIRHYNGLETVYAQLGKTCVKTGQIVKAGQVIGQTDSRELILHFETRFLNEHFNPETIIDFEEEDLIQNNIALMRNDFDIIPLDSLSKKKTVRNDSPKVVEQKEEIQEKQEVENKLSSDTQVQDKIEQQEPKSNIEQMNTLSQDAVYHTVAAGENLYRISLKYNTTVDKMLKLNNLKNADKIVEGQKLRVR